MIVLVSKYDKAAGQPVAVRRDLTDDEIQEMLAAENPGTVVACTEYSCHPDAKHSARIRAYAPSRCKASDPITARVPSNKGFLAFRGTVVFCGEHDGEDCSIYHDILSDGEPGRIEPIYKDDAICIPSRDEWLLLPEKIKSILAGALWCWTRTIDENGCAAVVDFNGDRGAYSVHLDSGGVAAFLRLSCLPDNIAQAIRDQTDADGVACFEPYTDKAPNGKPDCCATYFVRITNDVYGIGAFDRYCRRTKNDLTYIDKDGHMTYRESSLRAELNGTYLTDLITYIRKFTKEGN